MTDHFAMLVGYATIYFAVASLGATLAIVLTMLLNRALWRLVDAYGGIKVAREFVRWYRATHNLVKDPDYD